MKRKCQSGFSLVELLVVVVVIGIIAAMAVPNFLKAKVAAENRSAVALLSTIRSSQVAYYAQSGRYARLDELQQSQNGHFGNDWVSPTSNSRGSFTYTLVEPAPPTDINLKTEYRIAAVRDTHIYTVDQTGEIAGFVP